MWDENFHFPKKGVKNVGENMTFPPPEAEFLDEIQTKVLKIYFLAIHSHFYSFDLRFLFLSNSRNLLQFLEFSYCTL